MVIMATVVAMVGAAAMAAPVKIEKITTSNATGGPKYVIEKAIDGDKKTHWAGDVRRLPIWVRIDFAEAEKIDTLKILGVAQQKIYDNWRRVNFAFSDGTSFAVTFADTWKETTVRFPARSAKWVKVTIESLYKTTHYVGMEEIEATLENHGKAEPAVSPVPEKPVPHKMGNAKGAAAKSADLQSAASTPPEGSPMARLGKGAPTGKPRPELWMGDADIARAREHIRKYAWARQWYESVLQRADKFAKKSDDEIRSLVPLRGARFDKEALCPECGQRLGASFSRPHQVWCAKCKMAFPNAKYPDDGTGWKDPKTGRTQNFVAVYNDMAVRAFDSALADMADAYALTGEENFARAGSVLFDAIAFIYPTTDRGAEWYPGLGGRLRRPHYQAARALIWYCDAYDLFYRSPEWDKPSVDATLANRRANVEKNFIGNGGEYCLSEMTEYSAVQSLYNGYADYLQGVVAAGRVLGREDMMHYALTSNMNIFHFLENAIDRDGQYFETAFMYSSHALTLYTHHAEMLRNYRGKGYPDGINLYDNPKLLLAFRTAERVVECAGHPYPALGDTGPDLQVIRPGESTHLNQHVLDRFEHMAARLSDKTLRDRIRNSLARWVGDVDKARASSSPEFKRWLVYQAVDLSGYGDGPADKIAVEGNTLLPAGRGIGILRAGSARAALLRWGPTLMHGTPDEMNVNLYALGREITFDPGYQWAHVRNGWTHATGSHNLVVVNERNQFGDSKSGRGGDLEMWVETPGFRAMAANDTMCYASENVTQYRRTVCLADGATPGAYFLDVFRVKGGSTHDLNWHFRGEMTPGAGIALPEPQKTGSLAGPEYEWWKKLQPDGWVKGVPRKFYWKAPPAGNGYGFVYDLQRVEKPPRVAVFDWKVGERVAQPRWKFTPAEQVAASSGRVHKFLSAFGTYFYRAEKAGDWIEYRLPVEQAGEYLVVATFYRYPSYGTVQPYLDGKKLGGPVNAYSPTAYMSAPMVLGRKKMETGEHRLRFVVTGKDPESAEHYFSIGYLGLDRPDFLERMADKEPEFVRLRLLPPEGTEIIVGKAKGQRAIPVATYVISRRKDPKSDALASQFVSLVEPAQGRGTVEAFDRLKTEGAADDVAAVRIAMAGGRVDYVLESAESAAERVYTFDANGAKETVRFAGRFGVARLCDGRVESLTLDGPGRIETAGKSLRVPESEALWKGKVLAVDFGANAVDVNAKLPEGDALKGQVVQFANPAWSRRSPFQIARVERRGDGSRIVLDTASLTMAMGKVAEKSPDPKTLANTVPLDRAGKIYETRFFEGRPVRSEKGDDWGRVRDIDTTNWQVRVTSQAGAAPGERFTVRELAPGDAFFVRRVVRWTR